MAPVPTSNTLLSLASQLIGVESVAPDRSAAQDFLIGRLRAIGFSIERMDSETCRNFFARLGEEPEVLVFSGHTDVVPAGNKELWTSDPFQATVRNGKLFARGAADMKGAVAAMVWAVERFLERNEHPLPCSIAFLITGDEELGGQSARTLVPTLFTKGERVVCLVGEPSSARELGDTLKVGRRGSLSGRLKFLGKQGHVGYPQRAENAIALALPPLEALSEEVWDQGNEYFQPTSFQLTSIHGGVADNVIPDEVEANFNFRFSTAVTVEALQRKVETVLRRFPDSRHDITWELQAEPFLTEPGAFADLVIEAVRTVTGFRPKLSTEGGTSDGRHFAANGIPVIELGGFNKTIHQVDEHIGLEELEGLAELYVEVLKRFSITAFKPSSNPTNAF